MTRFIIKEGITIAVAQDSAVVSQGRFVDNAQCFPNIVVGYQHPNSAAFQGNNIFLQIANADEVDATEWFVHP
jgi:hypothetical protein